MLTTYACDIDNNECQSTPANHGGFELADMGDCELFPFATLDDCEDEEAQQFYTSLDEDEFIPPMFQWDAYYVIGC